VPLILTQSKITWCCHLGSFRLGASSQYRKRVPLVMAFVPCALCFVLFSTLPLPVPVLHIGFRHQFAKGIGPFALRLWF